MRRRLMVAKALVHRPPVLVLDEPTAGLDPIGREEMLELIRRIGRDFGIHIVLSTHLMGDVERVCDRIIVLENGRVVESGPVSGFTEESQTICIEVDDRREELVSALAARGIAATVERNIVAVELEREEQYDTIRDALVEAQARLRRLAPRRGSLTDIFRERT